MLAHLDGWLNSAHGLLLPRAIRRLDHRTLLRHPLLWRSRLLPVLCFALPLSAVSLALGLAVPMTSANVWTQVQIASLVGLLEMLMLIPAVFWARVQRGYAVGEQRLARHVQAGVYSALAITALLLPPQALQGGLSYRVAGVMPRHEFKERWAYHEEWDFWCCSSKIREDAVEAERARLTESLRPFGLTTDGEILPPGSRSGPEEPAFCPLRQTKDLIIGESPCLRIHDAQGQVRPHLLRERLHSIAAHQAATGAGAWQILSVIGKGLSNRVGLACGAAAILVLLSIPHYVWPRRFLTLDPIGRHRRLEIRLWLPQILRRLDRRLLLRRPMFWATRAHVFLFHALTIGLVLSLVILFLLKIVTRDQELSDMLKQIGGEVFELHGMLGIFALSPILWAATCRTRHIPAVSTSQLRRAIGTFFLANLPFPFVLGMIGGDVLLGDTGSVLKATAVTLIVVMPVVAWALVANFSNRTVSLMGLAVGLPLIFGPLLLAKALDISGIAEYSLMLGVPVCWIIAERAYIRRARAALQPPSHRILLLAGILVAAMPAAVFHSAIAFVELVSDRAGLPGDIMGPTSLLVIGFLAFGWGLLPSLEILVRGRYSPRST